MTPVYLILFVPIARPAAALPLPASSEGRAKSRLRQLRDPAVYEEGDGIYLLYSVAGESGIALSRIWL
jgi:hypothetical protein